MKKFLLVAALLGLAASPAWAHRLDEYLQATIFSIEPGSLQVTLRLVPGVAVAPVVIASIDTDRDGTLSDAEQHRYAETVLADLQLQEDGKGLLPRLTSAKFPSVAAMREGTGEIEIAFSARLATADGEHQLTFANHHMGRISVYLVNSLVPQSRALALVSQSRNETQSFYRVVFTEAGHMPPQSFAWSGFGGAFRLGVRHIAEGTDHLLFLLTLLLPAPLLVVHGRWCGRAPLRRGLMHILGIVTAFTLGHSLTLALSVFGLARLPGRPIEVLIAISILVSAVHAMRPLFPGRESMVAASFGLVHGLAFASALNQLGVTGWYRLVSLLGFNCGIEAMQLAVVALTLPALLLASRPESYRMFRVAGAVFACVASCAWIAERALNRPNAVGNGVEKLAQHGVMLCVLLWVYSAVTWLTDPINLNRDRTVAAHSPSKQWW